METAHNPPQQQARGTGCYTRAAVLRDTLGTLALYARALHGGDKRRERRVYLYLCVCECGVWYILMRDARNMKCPPSFSQLRVIVYVADWRSSVFVCVIVRRTRSAAAASLLRLRRYAVLSQSEKAKSASI